MNHPFPPFGVNTMIYENKFLYSRLNLLAQQTVMLNSQGLMELANGYHQHVLSIGDCLKYRTICVCIDLFCDLLLSAINPNLGTEMNKPIRSRKYKGCLRNKSPKCNYGFLESIESDSVKTCFSKMLFSN